MSTGQIEKESAPPSATGRYKSLDLLRGFACVGVIVAHASGRSPDAGSVVQEIIARLWWGLPAFYVISGYSISAGIERMRAKGTPLREYFLRRLVRIFPPYWAALAAAALVAWCVPQVLSHTNDGYAPILPPSELTRWQWLGTITLTEGWRDHLIVSDVGRWYLGTAWTLGYEEQFYILAGLLVLFVPRHWFVAAALVTLPVAAVMVLVPHEAVNGLWFNGRWIMFAFGIGVYYQAHVASGLARAVVPLAVLTGYAWSLTHDGGMGSPSLPAEIGVGAFTAAALMLLQRHDATISEMRALQPFAWCGLRCYSLYLIHWPIAKIMFWLVWTMGIRDPHMVIMTSVPATLLIALPAAAVFFRFVEKPCMLTGPRTGRAKVPRQPLPMPVTVPLGARPAQVD